MKLNNLKYNDLNRKSRKRLGRGTSSGHGKTSGKGHKGQNARSGGGVRLGFEGGQTPLFRRIPKFGFKNFSRKEYEIVNLGDLNNLNVTEETLIDHKFLKEQKLINSTKSLVKILTNGEITKPVWVRVNKLSSKAKEAILNNKGKVEVI